MLKMYIIISKYIFFPVNLYISYLQGFFIGVSCWIWTESRLPVNFLSFFLGFNVLYVSLIFLLGLIILANFSVLNIRTYSVGDFENITKYIIPKMKRIRYILFGSLTVSLMCYLFTDVMEAWGFTVLALYFCCILYFIELCFNNLKERFTIFTGK